MSMSKGEHAVLIIRSDKGYGANGFPAWGYPFYLYETESKIKVQYTIA